MVFLTERVIPLLLVLVIQVFNVSSQSRMTPTINVNDLERIINEGESIELECTGDEGLVFYYPKNDPKTSVPHNNASLIYTKNDTKTHVKFSLNSTTSQDTGYYGCAYKGSEFKENIYNSSKAAWLYIYVKSNHSLFVQTENIEISGYIRRKTVIPCRPTSPNYNVTLFHEDRENFVYKEVQCNDEIIFDPKFGFKIKNLAIKDKGHYRCQFIDEEKRPFQTCTFDLQVYHPPVIKIQTPPEFAIEGQDYHLECKIDNALSSYPDPKLGWIGPNGNVYQESSNENRITASPTISVDRRPQIEGISILTIKNITFSDAGNYTCVFLTDENLFNHTHIKVYDSNTQLIKLTSLNEKDSVDVCIGRNAEFAANINIHPDIKSDIKVEWTRSLRTTVITTNEKYEVKEENFTRRLIIKNSQESDKGLYVLRVSNGANTSATLEFVLQVILSPVIHFDTRQSHYDPLTEVEFKCHSTRPPATNITWFFQENGSYGKPESFKHAVVHQNDTFIESKISLKLNSTGNITCQVCNKIECERQVKSVAVADDTLLKLEKSFEEMTEGNNINVTCTGPMSYYTKIIWYNQDHEEIMENERIKFSVQNFSYNLGSIMSIGSINKSDEQSYWCAATTKNGSTVFKKLKLSVKAKDHPPQPVVIQSNMNGSVVYYDLETARQIVINLTCEVDKLQAQNISWFKDDQYIDGKNDTYQFFKGKQLLMITHPDKTCSGLYRCSVDGSDKALLKIVITDGPLKWPAITGIAVGTVACIALGIVGVILYWKKKNQKKSVPEDPLTDGNYAFINYGFVLNDPVQFERLISNWEIPSDKLDLGKRLGVGQFGQVLRGTVLGITAPNTETEVAVKIARRMKEPISTIAQNTEFRILCHVGKHLNIVNLLGVVRNVDRGLLLVVEYCRYGNFQEYLVKCRRNFFNPLDIKTISDNLSICARLKNKLGIQGRKARRDYVHSYVSRYANSDQAMALSDIEEAVGTVIVDPDCPPNLHRDYESEIILVEDLLIWAYQVALATDYISRKKIIHGDLAARNILLADNNVVKICDFGLARKLYQTDYHRKKSQTPMPVKWMAIESIEENLFTTKSDVWSYGVVLWEIFTLARSPYPGFDKPQEIFQQLSQGYRMPKPQYMPEEIYTVMRQCWESNPKSRPTFSQLVKTLGNMLPKHVAKYFITLNGSSAPSAKSEGIKNRNRPKAHRQPASDNNRGNEPFSEITMNAVAGCSNNLNSVIIHCDNEGVPLGPLKTANLQHPDHSSASTSNCCEQPNSNFASPISHENIGHSENTNSKSADSPS